MNKDNTIASKRKVKKNYALTSLTRLSRVRNLNGLVIKVNYAVDHYASEWNERGIRRMLTGESGAEINVKL